MTEHDARLAAEFVATLMGGKLADGPPAPDTMLAWFREHLDATPEELEAEFRRRGIHRDPADFWVWENPRFRRTDEGTD